MVHFALLFYAPLAVFSYAILLYRHGWDMFYPGPGWFAYSLAAVGISLAVVMASRVAGERFSWAREMEHEFMQVLGPLTAFEVAVLAGLSGLAEEAFFRGVVQPWLGLVFTSIFFGAVHLPYSPKLLPWTLFALAMGIVLGLLYDWSGSLIPPMVAHSLINGINLFSLSLKAERSGVPRRTFPIPPDDPDLSD